MVARQTDWPTVWSMVLTCMPMKMSAMTETMAMSVRIRAYSARPWPLSSLRIDGISAMNAVRCDIGCTVPPSLETPRRSRGQVGVMKKTAGAQWAPAVRYPRELELDGLADRVQDAADLAAQEDQSDDRDDRDEREDQGVLGEALAFLVAAKRSEDRVDECHVWLPL